jgi:hypothetical protein
MYRLIAALAAMMLLLGLAAGVSAKDPGPQVRSQYPGFYSTPPRFQIFRASGARGGLIMVDTQQGDSWQRVVVNTPKGIAIRWIELPKVKQLKPGETVIWE